jgi:hypothetical protein
MASRGRPRLAASSTTPRRDRSLSVAAAMSRSSVNNPYCPRIYPTRSLRRKFAGLLTRADAGGTPFHEPRRDRPRLMLAAKHK